LVQGAQGQGVNAQVLQLAAHLSQTEGQGTPPLDLDIQGIADALVRTQQATKVDLDTATAFTLDTRQVDR
jgi:hypothetical protein